MAEHLKRVALIFSVYLLAAGPSQASNLSVRLGLWHLTKPDFKQEPGLTLSTQKNFFYVEAAYEKNLARLLSFDITLGTIFRGTTRYQTSSGSIFLGTANVLPIGLGLTLYPLPLNTKLKPYLRGGGLVAIGNQNSGNFAGFDAAGNPVFNSKTRLTAGGYAAFGFGYRLMPKVRLTAELSYHHLKFSGPVAGLSNHSGYQILTGVNLNY